MGCCRCPEFAQREIAEDGLAKKHGMCFSCYWVDPVEFTGLCRTCGKIEELVTSKDSWCCGWFMSKWQTVEHAEIAWQQICDHKEHVAKLEAEITKEQLEEIKNFVLSENMIPAMRLYRQITGLGLVEAKFYVLNLKQ